jgi:mono/diheme cytochrome c family protein
MQRVLKVLGIVLGVVAGLVLAGVVVLARKAPAMRPAPTEAIERTPERLQRGKYLVHHVSDCLGCHSDHVAERYAFPISPGTEGKGGFVFDKKFGVPGTVCAQNITPDEETGIGRWSDGEILRALREGVDRDGNALFPMMPYRYFRSMCDEDARAVVAYLRSLPPRKNAVPKQKLDFPVNLLVKNVPLPVDGIVTAPDAMKDHLGYGKYLVTIAGCRECHTAHDSHGQIVPGRDFAGGWTMVGPWGRVVTANITPHPATFMGQATKEQFIGRIRAFTGFDAGTAPVASKGRNTVMPWIAYAGMTDHDLGAIFDYLKTLPAVENKVNPFPDAPEKEAPKG